MRSISSLLKNTIIYSVTRCKQATDPFEAEAITSECRTLATSMFAKHSSWTSNNWPISGHFGFFSGQKLDLKLSDE